MSILELKLQSKNIDKQHEFYSQKLGLTSLIRKEKQLCLQLGNTVLTFIADEAAKPYHFAINIPSEGEKKAFDWLKERVEILPDGESEIIDFPAWNAKSVYFYDADNNIVEFIARRNLAYSSPKDFGVDSMLEISEIGVAGKSVPDMHNFLVHKVGLKKFSGDMERFCAIGDEKGLFICVDRNEKKWYPTNDDPEGATFKIKISKKGKQYELGFNGEELKLLHGFTE